MRYNPRLSRLHDEVRVEARVETVPAHQTPALVWTLWGVALVLTFLLAHGI